MAWNEDDFNRYVDAAIPQDQEFLTLPQLAEVMRDARAYLAAADVPVDLQKQFAGRLITRASWVRCRIIGARPSYC